MRVGTMSKESQRPPVQPDIRTNIPISPSAKVAHVAAFRAQEDFPLDATIKLVSGTNPWRPNSLGWPLFEHVLRPNPVTTVGRVMELSFQLLRKGNIETMEHLRWLYTWGGSYVEINGRLYSPPPTAEQLPKRTRKRVGPQTPVAGKKRAG